MNTLLSIELDPENWFMEFGEKLLATGADPNMQDNEGCTVLMMACKYEGYTLYGDDSLLEFMKMLINNGADVSIKNNQGQTALNIAKEHQFEKAIDFLKQYESQLIVPNMNVIENTNAQPSTIGYPEKSF
ncbi:ankyrin repeat domain-containing protein [Falsibacillus pallidus]|uniref:ankyrin repeat domain-containing protein n=1 Tax=Falsibacillus pallidus TaxID=493781 RepID=UPI003D962BBE